MKEFSLLKKFNWQEASKPTIKKYVADLKQIDTDAPIATVLFNDTDITFTYEYVDIGVYAVTASKNIFTDFSGQFTQAAITNATYITDGGDFSGYSMTIFSVAPNAMIMLSSDLTRDSDDIIGAFTQNCLEITIYNK